MTDRNELNKIHCKIVSVRHVPDAATYTDPETGEEYDRGYDLPIYLMICPKCDKQFEWSDMPQCVDRCSDCMRKIRGDYAY